MQLLIRKELPEVEHTLQNVPDRAEVAWVQIVISAVCNRLQVS